MSAAGFGPLVQGSTNPALLGTAGGVTADTVPGVVSAVLGALLDPLPAALLAGLPVVLAAPDYGARATAAFVNRCEEAEHEGRKLRPLEAISPEPAHLVQEFAERGAWDGPTYVLINQRTATCQALRWARAAVSTGWHRAMAVCEITHDARHGAYLVVATLISPGGSPVPEPPAEDAASGSVLLRLLRGPVTADTARATGSAVVISGLGLVTGYGNGVARFWRGLVTGERALVPLTRFDPIRLRSKVVGQTTVTAPPGVPRRRVLLDLALREALAGAGLSRVPERALLTTVGVVPDLAGAGAPEHVREIALEPEWRGDGVVGPNGTAAVLAHACASGTFSLAMAREWLRCGLADVAVVTGVSSLNRYDCAAMEAVRTSSSRPARPYDLDRAGLTIGEGAGVAVLETAEHAAARGHTPVAVLAGIACRVGGAGRRRLHAEVGAQCVRSALAMAGLATVDYVHGHAPGTKQGDAAELLALETVGEQLGWQGVPLSSHKGAAGHLLHASAFPALAAAVRAIGEGTVPGTPGLDRALAAQRLRVLQRSERRPVRSVLVSNFGYGGSSAAMVLTAPPESTEDSHGVA
ncbi:hypothetical protein M8C13_00730 [Crossiella sp. SN42]|uniref:beta-ketoacyl synthase N-terminal-like domain-containing protein n=1 Tax=Crossiella sp. SN42 TaxID=2944808 RepID=UPI00207D5017|nr:beta-ketoacyl synthase N-terminal-like domain-containing protein [Crossiella sp. SN42]MCO1574282.1 hypothetical protein [Crossiella sp. SN42]